MVAHIAIILKQPSTHQQRYLKHIKTQTCTVFCDQSRSNTIRVTGEVTVFIRLWPTGWIQWLADSQFLLLNSHRTDSWGWQWENHTITLPVPPLIGPLRSTWCCHYSMISAPLMVKRQNERHGRWAGCRRRNNYILTNFSQITTGRPLSFIVACDSCEWYVWLGNDVAETLITETLWAKKEWVELTVMVFQGSHLQDQSEAMGLQYRLLFPWESLILETNWHTYCNTGSWSVDRDLVFILNKLIYILFILQASLRF